MRQVAEFERETACELVFHFRRKLGPDPLQANKHLFFKLKLDRTFNRKGILITLALAERQLVSVGALEDVTTIEVGPRVVQTSISQIEWSARSRLDRSG